MSEHVSRIFAKQEIHNIYTIRMARDITAADDFSDEFEVLAEARQEDTVKILISSGGGFIDTGLLLTKAINECRAVTVGYIGATVASAATAIALACDEWDVDEFSSFMIHTGSFGFHGKAPEVRAQTAHTLNFIDKWVRCTYDGFLTEEEIEKVIEGKDMYFEGEDLVQRLINFATKREEKRMQASQAELDDQEEND